MPAHRDTRSARPRWRYKKVIKLPDGSKKRICGTPTKNTKQAAEEEERRHIERELDAFYKQQLAPSSQRKEVPTFSEWFNGRFWQEWVVGQENKPGTRGEKESAFRVHLNPFFGSLPLDAIDTATIQQFKAELMTKTGRTGERLSSKTRNNILAILSKALRYAEEVEMIDKMPRIRLYPVERPQIVYWEFEQYAQLLVTAKQMDAAWFAATLLAGEAGLRIGEILALTWEYIDAIAHRLSIARQVRRGQQGTPKGRRRRWVPMTSLLAETLASLRGPHHGKVLRHSNGEPVTEGEAKHVIYRICDVAGLPRRSWHTLRHSMATHAARFGINPWTLQRWLGHQRIDETMRYVHLVEERPRPIPSSILQAGHDIADPDERVLAMLASRVHHVSTENAR